MTDYQIQASTRKCAASGRELQPGEKVYTVLLDQEGAFVRLDYASEIWQGPPAGAFSFWQGRVPGRETKNRPRIDDDLLLECFQRLEADNEPGRLSFRYVIALLLMRRKQLRFDEATHQGDREVLRLTCVRTRASYEVVNPGLSDDEMVAVQEQVFQLLGWDG